MEKQSLTYRLLKLIGLRISESEYGNVSIGSAFNKFYKKVRNTFLMKYCFNIALLAPFNSKKIRPLILRRMGCKVGKGVFIGDNVSIDKNFPELITIGDNSYITGGTTLLCHKRDISNYRKGVKLYDLPYKKAPIVIGEGCSTGTNTLILPGVTIGDGAVIGAGSLVTKDIPAWTLAVGRPAKVIKEF
jgi:acetyltransferase-like isoleucine patch superfamily enzyme